MADSGNFEELTSRQRRALGALLTERDVKAAAKRAKVGYRTLCRWLTEEPFRRALVEAEGQVIDQATRRLVGLADRAIETLRELLDSPTAKDSIRLRAAQSVLDNLLRLRELVALDARVSELEARMEVQE